MKIDASFNIPIGSAKTFEKFLEKTKVYNINAIDAISAALLNMAHTTSYSTMQHNTIIANMVNPFQTITEQFLKTTISNFIASTTFGLGTLGNLMYDLANNIQIDDEILSRSVTDKDKRIAELESIIDDYEIKLSLAEQKKKPILDVGLWIAIISFLFSFYSNYQQDLHNKKMFNEEQKQTQIIEYISKCLNENIDEIIAPDIQKKTNR